MNRSFLVRICLFYILFFVGSIFAGHYEHNGEELHFCTHDCSNEPCADNQSARSCLEESFLDHIFENGASVYSKKERIQKIGFFVFPFIIEIPITYTHLFSTSDKKSIKYSFSRVNFIYLKSPPISLA